MAATGKTTLAALRPHGLRDLGEAMVADVPLRREGFGRRYHTCTAGIP